MRILIAVLLLLGPILGFSDQAMGREHTKETPPAESFWPGPSLSGSWYDPSRSGEGFILEYMPDGTVIMAWFTFPAVGAPGQQDWLMAEGGRFQGNRLVFDQVYTTRGGRWGAAFDPAQITRALWGTVEFAFLDCNQATVQFSGPASHGSGSMNVQRLTAIDQLTCQGPRDINASGSRALSGLRATSGVWFVANRSGEGWFLEELPDDRLVVYWFTYDPQGNPAWFLGVGARVGDRVVIDNMHVSHGTRFGSAFNPADIRRTLWGQLDITFADCTHFNATHDSVLAGYGSGSHAAVRLSRLAGSECIDGTPQTITQGTWSEVASMPGPAQSELDAATLDGKLYALGGFGDTRGFKRYDSTSGQWSVLTALPSGRHHLSAFAFDGGIYYAGGEPSGGGESGSSGYRYDPPTNTWEARPEMPFTFGSRAAVSNGRVFFGIESGDLYEYDPRQRIRRFIDNPDNTARDHGQVQAFLGEIWLIGGRSPETRSVSIYDPATETWRAGPSLNRARGGFGATVVGQQLIIGGGENIGGIRVLVPSMEMIAAGVSNWSLGPNLAVPVHGTAAVTLDGRAYFVSGSTEAGAACCATGRLLAFDPADP